MRWTALLVLMTTSACGGPAFSGDVFGSGGSAGAAGAAGAPGGAAGAAGAPGGAAGAAGASGEAGADAGCQPTQLTSVCDACPIGYHTSAIYPANAVCSTWSRDCEENCGVFTKCAWVAECPTGWSEGGFFYSAACAGRVELDSAGINTMTCVPLSR